MNNRQIVEIPKYRYPEGLDLRPSSDVHKNLLLFLNRLVTSSQANVRRRVPIWQELDRKLTAYVVLDDKELKIKNDDSRKPVRLVVPAMYAALDILLTYMVSVFFVDPMFRYSPVNETSDIAKARMLEIVVNQHVKKFKTALRLYTQWRDSLVYGLGAVHPIWRTIKYRYTPSDTSGFRSLIKRELTEQSYSGNALLNLDVYNFFPDSNVPVDDIQSGSFVAWAERRDMNSFMEMVESQGFFNDAYVWNSALNKSSFYTAGRDTQTNKGYFATAMSEDMTVDLVYVYCKLIPAMHGMGSNRQPEKWLFVIAGDKYIVQAEKLSYDHYMYPVSVAATNFDGHSTWNISLIETLHGLQEAIDWFYSSRVANVRKAINDSFVVDPYLINIEDLVNPNPAKIIRLRRHAFGRGVKDAIQQLSVVDVTQGHLNDIAQAMQLIDLGSGATDAVKGIRRDNSARVTAAEANAVTNSALSRLQKLAMLIGIMSHTDIGMQFAFNARQFMTESMVADLTSAEMDDYRSVFAADQITIRPEDINVNVDVNVSNGLMEDTMSMETLVSLFQVIGQNEGLQQQIDAGKLFKFIMKKAGVSNLNSFLQEKPVAMPTEQVADLEARGAIAPIAEVA